MAVDPRLRERAQAALRADKSHITGLTEEDRDALLEELHTHQIELEIQNEELRAVQLELQAARDGYAELYEQAPVAYLTLDGDDTIQQVNLTAAELFGKTRSELVGSRWSQFLHRDDQDVWYLYRKQLVDSVSRRDCELRIRTATHVLIAQVATRSIQSPVGTPPKLLVSLTDVTQRRAAEQELRQRTEELDRSRLSLLSMLEDQQRTQQQLHISEQRFRSLLASLDDVVWSTSLDGDFLYLNRAVEHVYGLPYETCLADQKFWLKAVLPEDLAVAEQTNVDLFERGYANAEYRIRHADGSVRWLLDRKHVVKEGDEIIAVGGIATDITDRKQAEMGRLAAQEELSDRLQHEKEIVEAELDKAREAVVQTTRMTTIGRVAAQMAHELRNPLGTVRNAAFFIRGELPSDMHEARSMLQLIDEEVATADIIIQDLLSATRPPEANPRKVDVILNVIKAFARLRFQEGISLRLDAPSQPVSIYFDPLQMHQLLNNLLSNACDAVGVSGQVTVQVRIHDDAVELRVIDSGPGIPAEIRDSVFEPFFTTKPQGTGLGLAICRQIIEQHGGTIRIEDDPEGGSKIVVGLPHVSHSPARGANLT